MKKNILFCLLFCSTTHLDLILSRGGAPTLGSLATQMRDAEDTLEEIHNAFKAMHGIPSLTIKSSISRPAVKYLEVDKNGQFELEFPEENILASVGNKLKSELLTNQKLFNSDGKLEIRLLQLKESNQNYKREIVVTGNQNPNNEAEFALKLSISVTTSRQKELKKNNFQSVSSSEETSSNTLNYAVKIPAGYIADVESVTYKENKIIVQLMAEAPVDLILAPQNNQSIGSAKSSLDPVDEFFQI